MCDGYAHIVGPTSIIGVVTETYTNETCAPFPATPTCSVQQTDCAALISARGLWDGSFASSCGDHVECHLSSTQPPPSASITTTLAVPQDCGPCTIYGDTVQLLYFPVATNASKDMCTTSPSPPTLCPFGRTTAGNATAIFGQWATGACPYTVIEGTTLYKNRAYISYVGASARNSCGQVGKSHHSGVVAVPSSDIYSVSGYHYEWEAAAHSFNFADLNPPVPASAFFMQQWCDLSDGLGGNVSLYDYRVNGVGHIAGLCQGQKDYVIYDESYNPMIALPPQFRALDPAWSQCLLQLGGVYDPPKPLQQATSLDAPTKPAPVSTATTPATPAQTASPATVIATATSPEVSQTESSISQSTRPSSKNSDAAPATSQGDDGESAEAEQPTSTLAVSSTVTTSRGGGLSTSETPPTYEPGTSEIQGSNVGLSDGDPARLSTTDAQDTGVPDPLERSTDQTTPPATPDSPMLASFAQDQTTSTTDPSSQLAGMSLGGSPSSVGLGALIVSVINGASMVEDQPPRTASSAQSANSNTLTRQPDEIAQTSPPAEGVSSPSSGGSESDPGRSTISADDDPSNGSAATGGGSQPDQTTSSPSADPGGLIVSVITGASAVQVQSSSDVRSPQPSLGSATVSQARSLDSEITATSGTAITSPANGSPTESPSLGVSDPGSNNPNSVDGASSLKNAPGSAFTTITTPVAVVTVGSAILTVQQSQTITVGDQAITPGGSAAIVSGNTISIGTSGVVVGGIPVDFQPSILVPASAISAQVGTADVGGSSFDATLLGSFFILGSQTLTVGGSAITLSGGATASAGSSGDLVLGASQTVKIGSDLSSVVLTANGQTITAIPASGDPRAAVVDSSATLSQDGSAHVVDGLILSLGRSGIVVNGADTVELPTQVAIPHSATLTIDGQLYTVSQATPSIDAVDGSEVLTAEDSAKTLPNGESVSATPPVILIDGSTVRIGTANTPLVTEIQGHLHTFSELSPGLQVVDGSITLEVGAAATTLSNGEVLSAVSGSAVVDGTSISVPVQYSAMTTSIGGHAYTISRGAVGVYAINGVTVPLDGMPTTLPHGAVLSVGTSLGSPTISLSQSERFTSSPTGVATTTASTTQEGGTGPSRCGRMFSLILMAISAAIALY
ncbi:hypothetical protein LTR56_020328 [Elasticomyces elasticus]|nr:hypothetical protein LTR56_020328 [Elasticomyces elasticus]KAK3655615.1 hypothetical protein LTR22_010205 [Elasticomyces elasticus]KAK4910273.1 hypothetical protein LTR49_021019 [Elasticomyces elasticus]KAK5748511.1 hypothetical protein LTS12_021413 [Elasticomyces elasticus]